MLLTEFRQIFGNRAAAGSQTAGQAAPAAALTNGSATPAAGDQLALTQTAQNSNPYQGTAPGHTTVQVGRWGSGQSDSLAQILHEQGYTSREVYRKNEQGRTLLDEVTRVNNLRNPNLVREGQELIIPSKTVPEGQPEAARPAPERTAPAPAPAPERAEPAAPAAQPAPEATAPVQPTGGENQRPDVTQVRVDRWRQGPNDSLSAILRNRGFSDQDIFRKDGNGDTLLDKVARANGMENANNLRAGRTIEVPNSMEALAQMNIPERPAAQPEAQVQQPQAPVAQPEAPVQQPEAPAQPTETPVQQPEAPAQQPAEPAPPANGGRQGEATANMGMLLDGIRGGQFKRDEFQYLNALSNRYEETRAEFSQDGFSQDELRTLGGFERRYGSEFARLYNRDDIRLTDITTNTDNPKTQLRIRHYQEGGTLWDNYSNGTTNTEDAITVMMRQRAEAREQGGQ